MSDEPIEREISARVALTIIAGEKCSAFTSGDCRDHRDPLARYGADKWCDACIARAGLEWLDRRETREGLATKFLYMARSVEPPEWVADPPTSSGYCSGWQDAFEQAARMIDG